MAKRILLIILTNILVITTITVICSVFGVGKYITGAGLDYRALLGFCLIYGFAGAFISLAISRWMAKWLMGVNVLTPGQAREQEWIVQMVHHLARKANLPEMPEVGIYESDEVNAFATGPSKSRSLVAFSSGLLQKMDRDAVEGVAAHEVAHIQNGDMITMTLLQGIINAFVMFFARIIGYAASQAVDEKYSSLVWNLTVIILQIVFGILGCIVTCWFSRQREFRADEASGRLSSREKMAHALRCLKPIVENERESTMPASMAAFGIASKSNFMQLFSTHPSLDERIARLES